MKVILSQIQSRAIYMQLEVSPSIAAAYDLPSHIYPSHSHRIMTKRQLSSGICSSPTTLVFL